MSEIQRVFDRAIRTSEERQWIPGRLGRINGDGSITLRVQGRPNFVHVRVGPDGELGPSIARNLGVPLRVHLPVRMRREQGVLVVHGVDHTGGRLDVFLGDTALATVGYHTHRVGGGLEFKVQAALMEPYWSGTAIGDTPQTILSSGVDHLATVQYALWSAAGAVGGVAVVLNDGHNNIVFGADVFQLAVSDAGALTIARISGTNTAGARLWVVYG